MPHRHTLCFGECRGTGMHTCTNCDSRCHPSERREVLDSVTVVGGEAITKVTVDRRRRGSLERAIVASGQGILGS